MVMKKYSDRMIMKAKPTIMDRPWKPVAVTSVDLYPSSEVVPLCLLNFYTEYMQNARPDEAEAGIKIVRRNINNLGHADDTTLMAEREEDLNSL